MKIATKYMPIKQFETVRHKRKCWKKCNECDTELISANTEYVHMIVNSQSECRFLCDNCEYENSNT